MYEVMFKDKRLNIGPVAQGLMLVMYICMQPNLPPWGWKFVDQEYRWVPISAQLLSTQAQVSDFDAWNIQYI